MSAYGTIAAPTSATVQEPRIFSCTPNATSSLVVFHLRRNDVPAELATLLRNVFNNVVEEGKTYPQEEILSADAFDGYFLSNDLFVGLLVPAQHQIAPEGQVFVGTMADCKQDKPWEDVVAGMYYIKPNYPGRSSHNCNGGFIVVPKHRGLKLGYTLGKTYLHYAPLLGYRASVFNLVYMTNKASLAIWDKLGFQRVGLIPQAGRLKTGVDGQEEYVDAAVYYKAFS